MQPRWFRPALFAVVLSASALGGCASHSQPGQAPDATASEDTNNDPYESFNRSMWDVDLTLDRYLLKPIAIGYRDATPSFFQRAVSNVLTNLRGPVIFVNDLLQGQPGRAGTTFMRLYLNTVFGLGGILDVATYAKIPYHNSDFGETLGVWGVDSGPYLVLPLLGPSDPRDGIGYGIDSFIDPFSIEMRAHGMDEANYVRWGVGVVNDRAGTIDELDELQKSSLDFYAAVRSLYQQQRQGLIDSVHGGGTPTPSVSYDEPSSPTPSKAPDTSSGSGKAQ